MFTPPKTNIVPEKWWLKRTGDILWFSGGLWSWVHCPPPASLRVFLRSPSRSLRIDNGDQRCNGDSEWGESTTIVLAPQSAYKSLWRGYTTNILNHIVLSLLSCLYHQAKQCTVFRGYVPRHYHVFELLYPPELETHQPWSRRKITTTLNCSDRMNRQILKVQITLNLQHEKQTLDIFVGLCSLNTFTDMLGLFADSRRKDCEGRHVHQAAVWLLYDIHHFVCILWWPWPPLTARQLWVMLYSISDNPHRHNTFKNTWPV